MTTHLAHKAKNRYMDPYSKLWTVKILPGEYYVCAPEETVVTTLGSCIAACIWDKKLKIGGMNHFMLAQSELGAWAGEVSSTRFGNFAMEYLINEILKRGGQRENLRAKIFGGASMNTGGEKVGGSNISFAKTYLKTEKIPILAEDVGGEHARKVYFHPETGDVTVKEIMALSNDTLEQREKKYAEELKTQEKENDDIMLF